MSLDFVLSKSGKALQDDDLKSGELLVSVLV